MFYFILSFVVCAFFACPGIVIIFSYTTSQDLRRKKERVNKAPDEPAKEDKVENEPKPPPKPPKFIQDRVPPLFDELMAEHAPTPRSCSSEGSTEEPPPPPPEGPRFILSSRLAFSGPHLELSIQGRRLDDNPMPTKIRYAIGATSSSLNAADPKESKSIILSSRVRRPTGHRPQWALYDHVNDALRPWKPPVLIRTPPAPPQLAHKSEANASASALVLQPPKRTTRQPLSRPLPGRLAGLTP